MSSEPNKRGQAAAVFARFAGNGEARVLALFAGVALAGSMAANRLLTEVVAPATLGEFYLLLNVTTWMTLPSGSGYVYVSRHWPIAKKLGKSRWFAKAILRVASFQVAMCGAAAVVLFQARQPWCDLSVGVLLFIVGSAQGVYQAIEPIQAAERKRVTAGILSLFVSPLRPFLVAAGAALLAAKSPHALLSYHAAGTVLLAAAGVFALFLLLRSRSDEPTPEARGSEDLFSLRAFARYAGPYFLGVLAMQVCATAERWGLAVRSDAVATALFVQSVSIGTAAVAACGNLVTSYYVPIVMQAAGADPRPIAAARHHLKRYVSVAAVLLVGLVALGGAFAPVVTGLFFGARFASVARLLPWAFAAAGIFAFGQVLTVFAVCAREVITPNASYVVSRAVYLALLLWGGLGAQDLPLRFLVYLCLANVLYLALVSLSAAWLMLKERRSRRGVNQDTMVGTGATAGARALARGSIEDGAWHELLSSLGVRATFVAASRLDRGRRVYADAQRVYKVVWKGIATTGGERRCSPEAECGILRRLSGLSSVPSRPEFAATTDAQVLSYDHIAGLPFPQMRLGVVGGLLILARLVGILARLSARGVVHGDVHPENLLVGRGLRLTLIDFDQSFVAAPSHALKANFVGRSIRMNGVHGDFVTTAKAVLRDSLPSWLSGGLRRLRWWWRRTIAYRRTMPPSFSADAPAKLRYLQAAWLVARRSNASSPGTPIAYYDLVEDGYRFPGERPWSPRWQVLEKATEIRGKRVLELGCNLGLLSASLLARSGAQAAMCVDADADILAAAQYVSAAYAVSPLFRRVDFDAAVDWEQELERFQPDVVFALNVLNWVHDKERLLSFLGRFSEVVFEGHDTPEVEIERLRRQGFDSIEVIDTSERARAVLRCRKRA